MEVGSVVAWGRHRDGELGIGRKEEVQAEPKMVSCLESQGVVQVSCGDRFTLCRDEFGNVLSFGACSQGQLGHGQEREQCRFPEQVAGDLLSRRIVTIAAGFSSCAAVSEEGELFEWGLLHYIPEDKEHASLEMHGMVSGRKYVSEQLQKLLKESTMRYLTSTEEDRVAKRANSEHQSSDESSTDNAEAKADEGVVNLRTRRHIVPLPRLNTTLGSIRVNHVAIGAAHVAVISRDGKIYTKGYNDRGQLGTGNRVSRADFQRVHGPINDSFCVDMVCGSSHCLALTVEGRIWAFGANAFGQLGLGPKVGEQLIPMENRLLLEEKVVQIAAGEHHSLCLTAEGEVLSFGHAEYGQHGGMQSGAQDLQYAHLMRHFFSPRPVAPFWFKPREELPVPTFEFVPMRSIASNARYSLGIDVDGQLWSWGWNGNSVLGHGRGARWTNPRIVEELAGEKVNSVSAGPNHVMVVVKQTGSQFALSYSSLLPKPQHLQLQQSQQAFLESGEHVVTFDTVIRSTLSATQSKVKDAQKKHSVECHSFVVFSRCQKLRDYVQPPSAFEDMEESKEKKIVQLPFVMDALVLYSLVEYLYCDHVRSCPPHRLIDLERVGQELGLLHLVGVCKLSRYQRQLKQVINIDQTSPAREAPLVPPSTFEDDMYLAYQNEVEHDVYFQAAEEDLDEDEEEEEEPESALIPASHTAFSWRAASTGVNYLPLSHTSFSLGIVQSAESKENRKNNEKKNGKIVTSAHMDILCRYMFFGKLLTGSFKEAQSVRDPSRPVLLHNLTPRGLSRLIHWMYCGDREASIDPATVMSLLATARCFGVEDLARVCEKYILDGIDESNFEFIEDFARDENNVRLLHRCSLVRQHARSFAKLN